MEKSSILKARKEKIMTDIEAIITSVTRVTEKAAKAMIIAMTKAREGSRTPINGARHNTMANLTRSR